MRINTALLDKSSHSPSLIDLVGIDQAADFVDFCFIANPYYPTEAMIDQMIDRFKILIKTYPKSDTRVNHINLAKVIGVDPDKLIIGNGATELITEICDHFVESLGIPIPTFAEYIEKALPSKTFLYPLDWKKNYQMDLMRYAQWLLDNQIKAALVINPSNPTGQLFSLSDMHHFLKMVSTLDLVIVDESFIDFASEDEVPSLLHSTQDYPNLVIVRSMSKHCGVPGLRLGYAHTSNTELCQTLKKHLPTWNINTLAEYYLSLLVSTEKEYETSRLMVVHQMRWLYEELSQIKGIKPYPTGANFILIKLENGLTAKQCQKILLEDYHLYVRDCSNKQGMDNYHIRVASQGRDNDSRLIDALSRISKNALIDNYSILRKRAPRVIIPTAHHLRKTRYIQYVGDQHLNLVLENGGVPLMVPNLQDNIGHIDIFLSDADALLLVEGEDISPEYYEPDEQDLRMIDRTNAVRDRIEKYILQYALDRDLPILAICRGHQLLNVVLGGTLYTDVVKTRERSVLHQGKGDTYNTLRHGLNIVENSLLYDIYGTTEIRVNSYHHQGVKSLGKGLNAMAYAEDGLIEATIMPDRKFVVGLQFHPERCIDEYPGHREIFKRFIASVG